MDPRNKILIAMGAAGHQASMDAIRRYLVFNTKGREKMWNALKREARIEPVSVEDGARVTSDGREVFWWAGQSYAQTAEAHEKARLQSIESAKRLRTANVPSNRHAEERTSCQAVIDGQLCGGDLQRKGVCPKCTLGRQGITELETCDVCGRETAVMASR